MSALPFRFKVKNLGKQKGEVYLPLYIQKIRLKFNDDASMECIGIEGVEGGKVGGGWHGEDATQGVYRII